MVNDEIYSWVTLDILRIPARIQTRLIHEGAAWDLVNKMTVNPSKALLHLLDKKGQKWVHDKDLKARDVSIAQKKAQTVLEELQNAHMGVLTPRSHPWLFQSVHPPLCLYGIGNLNILAARSPKIAVVGSRNPTDVGLKRTEKWVQYWAQRGFCIVSGGAKGIDIAAHKSALGVGGNTIAVLGTEWSRMTDPRMFHWVPETFKSSFCALTEYASWKPCHKGAFVARNRLVAGMSDLTIMMEGHQKSGALHTLKYAKQQEKKTFAVAGAPELNMSTGASFAFATGLAQPALSAPFVVGDFDEDFKKMNLPLDYPAQVAINAPLSPPRNAIGEPNQKAVYQFLHRLPEKCACFDKMVSELQLNVSVLQIALSELEMNGWIKQKGALYYAT